MIELILAALGGQVRARVRRAGNYAALAAIAAVFVAIAIAALVGALFLWLKERLTPIESALVIAGGALVIALVVSGPLWWPKRRPAPRPTPSPAEFAAPRTQRAPVFSPQKMALGAVKRNPLGAVGLAFGAGLLLALFTRGRR